MVLVSPQGPALEPLMSTDASGGGLDLEAVYKAATPVSSEDLTFEPTLEVDESEDAPLMGNIN
jgi:hypothetical protein